MRVLQLFHAYVVRGSLESTTTHFVILCTCIISIYGFSMRMCMYPSYMHTYIRVQTNNPQTHRLCCVVARSASVVVVVNEKCRVSRRRRRESEQNFERTAWLDVAGVAGEHKQRPKTSSREMSMHNMMVQYEKKINERMRSGRCAKPIGSQILCPHILTDGSISKR